MKDVLKVIARLVVMTAVEMDVMTAILRSLAPSAATVPLSIAWPTVNGCMPLAAIRWNDAIPPRHCVDVSGKTKYPREIWSLGNPFPKLAVSSITEAIEADSVVHQRQLMPTSKARSLTHIWKETMDFFDQNQSSWKLLLGATCVVMTAGCGKPTQPPPPPLQVGVFVVEPKPLLLSTELPGRTVAYKIAEIRPQVGGVVIKRMFKEGEVVRAGQQLYQIDPAPLEANLQTANATLQKAQATHASARLLADRYKDLISDHAVSQQDYDNAVASAASDEADVASAAAGVLTAEINLRYARVLSPITGRTGRSTITEGALVTADQATALVIVSQLDPIYVDITQPSTMLLRLRREFASGELRSRGTNQADVNLSFEDGSAYPLTGELKFSEVTVDQSTGTVVLRSEFPNPDGSLLPGMFVREVLSEGVNQNALLVPQQGISHDQKGGAFALVSKGDGKIESQPVVTDRALGDEWLISKGLKEGDQVVVEGSQQLQHAPPGALVKTRVMTLDELRNPPLPPAQAGAARAPTKS